MPLSKTNPDNQLASNDPEIHLAPKSPDSVGEPDISQKNNHKALQLALDIQTCHSWSELVDTCVQGFRECYSAVEVRWMECVNKPPREIWNYSASPACHTFVSKHMRDMLAAFAGLSTYCSKVGEFFYREHDDILCLSDHYPAWELTASRFYRDYMLPMGIEDIICLQPFYTGTGGLAILAVGLPIRYQRKRDEVPVKAILGHVRTACKRMAELASLSNLTATLGALRQTDAAVGIAIVGNDGETIWEVDPTSTDLIKELGGVYHAAGLALPKHLSAWIKQNLDKKMRICAQTQAATQTFKTWDARDIEITLYLERAGRGVVLVLKKPDPFAQWDLHDTTANTVPPVRFTKRQLDVIRSLDAGMGTYEIADALNISKRTVDKHLENIYSRLGVNNRVAALNRFHQFQQQAQQKSPEKHRGQDSARKAQ